MSAIVMITYARSPDLKFDHSHYFSTHMPLCNQKWAKHGFQSWDVVEMSDDSPYAFMCVMRWTSMEAYQKAMKEDGAEIMADVKNFTNVRPVALRGNVKESWSG